MVGGDTLLTCESDDDDDDGGGGGRDADSLTDMEPAR